MNFAELISIKSVLFSSCDFVGRRESKITQLQDCRTIVAEMLKTFFQAQIQKSLFVGIISQSS